MHFEPILLNWNKKHWEKPGIFSKETAGGYILSTEVQPTNLYVKTLSLTFTTVQKLKAGKVQLFCVTLTYQAVVLLFAILALPAWLQVILWVVYHPPGYRRWFFSLDPAAACCLLPYFSHFFRQPVSTSQFPDTSSCHDYTARKVWWIVGGGAGWL